MNEVGAEGERLAAELPAQVADLIAQSNTPHDLVALTNATRVNGADYVDPQGLRRGGALLLHTEGRFYEHERGVCDRVRGGKLLDVSEVDLGQMRVLESTLLHAEEGRVEVATTLRLLRVAATGAWLPQPHWLPEDSAVPSEGDETISLQVWADSRGGASSDP